ncbi:uncharacterized protein N7515_009744 [Penicillium bovifimosum]|uniref:LysM domain-containing protein n=1 Tax=Penicillium bovifimosum TaxID=126998 RepID=A0A9W9GHI7_9EURO|nr:uncharacterized protein N7515_009744 [Penicillium bovifimosum]KAJ5120356.1 hypothetical protein N7515_009744 [Penicillium bovifimosum]
MKGLAYFAVIASVQASKFAHQSLHRGATSSPSCNTYTVKDGDTCAKIGKSSGVTWAQLLSWNSDINRECSNLGDLSGKNICISNPAGDYAIPVPSSTTSSSATGSQSIITTTASIPSPTVSGTNSKCARYHRIGTGETCDAVVKKSGISMSDFLFLNSEINEKCTNLQLGVYYCVQAVGYITTYPGYGGTSDDYTKVSMTAVPSSVPRPDYPGALPNNSYPVIPLANGTRKDCYDYMWLSNTTDDALADCWTMAMTNGVSAEVCSFFPWLGMSYSLSIQADPSKDFIMWNPSLEEKPRSSSSIASTASASASSSSSVTPDSYYYPCTLRASSSYCVMLSQPKKTKASGSRTTSSIAASSTQSPKPTSST